MTKTELAAMLDGMVSAKCIQQGDGETRLVGKYCQAVPADATGDTWDLWLCTPDALSRGLGERKLTNLLTLLDVDGWVRLTGEAYHVAFPKAWLLANLRPLGIRRKRGMSEEQKAAAVERLAAAHLNRPRAA